MRTNNLCPISDSKIDENAARLNATLTVITLIVFLLTNNIFTILLLLTDFTLRGTENSKYSIFAVVSKQLIKTFRIKKKPVNAGPKIFAARIGILFSMLVFIFSVFGFSAVAQTFALVFGLCAFLEAAFGFCVACRIYPFVYRLSYRSGINELKI